MANRNRYEWRLVPLDPKQIEYWDACGWEAFAARGDQLLMRTPARPCEQENAQLTMEAGTRKVLASDELCQDQVEYETWTAGSLFCIRGDLYDRETLKELPVPCPKCSGPSETE